MQAGDLVGVGVLLIVWGLLGLAARGLVANRRGPLGGARAFWMRRGFYFAPPWLTLSIVTVGVGILLFAGVLAASH